MSNPTKHLELSDFWHRRSFKIIVGYIVGGWTFLEFLNFILERLNISPYWVEIFLLVFLLFAPTLLLMALAPKNKKVWRILHRWFPWINISIILAVLVTQFWSKDLGRMTTNISYLDDDGINHIKTVLKDGFIKRVAIARFEPANQVNKPDEWLGRGLAVGINTNLRQFQSIRSLLHDQGFKSLKSQIEGLKQANLDYLIRGNYATAKDSIYVQLQLYNNSGNRLLDQNFSGVNLFQMLDDIKKVVLPALDVHAIISKEIDLPFSEFVTDNLAAYKHFVKRDHINAINEDDQFAYAYLAEINRLNQFGGSELSKKELTEKGLNHVEKLPDHDQLLFKAKYFHVHKGIEKAKKTYERYLLLNPGDEEVEQNFVHFLATYGYQKEAIDLTSKMLRKRFDPITGNILLQLYLLNGQTRIIRNRLRDYRFFMKDYTKKTILGLVNMVEKNFQEAEKNFNDALLDKPYYFTLDSLLRSSVFMQRVNEDSLENFISKVQGSYMSTSSGLTYQIAYANNNLIIIYEGQLPQVINPMGKSSIYDCNPLFESQWGTKQTFFPGKTGRILKVKSEFGTDTVRWYYDFKMTDELTSAFGHFDIGQYELADSLFQIVQQQDPGYYFVEQYRKAIAFKIANGIHDLGANTYHFINGKKETFEIRWSGDCFIQQEKNTMKLFPTQSDWLMNTHSREITWQIRRSANGYVMDRYKYNDELAQFELVDSYSEVKP